MPIEYVDRVFENDRPLHERDVLPVIDLLFEVSQVLAHLGDEPVVPPIREIRPIHREHGAEVRTDLRRILRVILRHSRVVDVSELGGRDRHVRITRHGCRVQIAVDDLGDPVRGERSAEATEHVVAGHRPDRDVHVHRRHRPGAVQVVVDPEEILFLLAFPFDGEALVTQELGNNLAGIRHTANLLPVQRVRPKADGGGELRVNPLCSERPRIGMTAHETRRYRAGA